MMSRSVARMSLTADDLHYMQRALSLAEKGLGKTSPNPNVGAVLVRRGEIIGEGFHRKAGKPHAEIEAIRDAQRRRNKIEGATLYVTLEPCCHTGRTLPCTSAIIEAGISRVYYSVKDPDKRVSGKGAGALRKAGIEVQAGLGAEDAEQVMAPYLHQKRTGTPFVIVKLATSLDGYIATQSGESKWITSDAARNAGRRLRGQVDAVIVGSRTVISDNSALTSRVRGMKDPLRIIVIGRNRLPESLHVLTKNADRKTILAVPRDRATAIEKKYRRFSITVWPCATLRNGLISIPSLLEQSWQHGVLSLLVEGGGKLIASFIQARRVNRWHQFLAPKLIGGGLPGVPSFGISKLGKAPQLSLTAINMHGRDIELVGDVEFQS